MESYLKSVVKDISLEGFAYATTNANINIMRILASSILGIILILYLNLSFFWFFSLQQGVGALLFLALRPIEKYAKARLKIRNNMFHSLDRLFGRYNGYGWTWYEL